MDPEDSKKPQPTQAPLESQKPANFKVYSKQPVWQWVLIYLIVAIIIYGLIYLIFIHKSGSSSSSY